MMKTLRMTSSRTGKRSKRRFGRSKLTMTRLKMLHTMDSGKRTSGRKIAVMRIMVRELIELPSPEDQSEMKEIEGMS